MTKNAKYTSQLYQHTKQTLNSILRLEYAIRATKLFDSEQYKHLVLINEEIRQFWRSKEYNDTQIRYDFLMDYSFDFLQGNHTVNRSDPTTVVPQEYNQEIGARLLELEDLFKVKVDKLNFKNQLLPRYVDLANGNDLSKLLAHYIRSRKSEENDSPSEAITSSMENTGAFSKEIKKLKIERDKLLKKIGRASELNVTPEGANLACFLIDYRKPVFITSHAKIMPVTSDDLLALALVVQIDQPIGSLKRIFLEFLQTYINYEEHPDIKKNRKSDEAQLQKNNLSKEASKLYSIILHEEFTDNSHSIISRHDSFLGSIIGLIAWDIKQSTTIDSMLGEVKEILEEIDPGFSEMAAGVFGKKSKLPSSEESIQKYYREANRKIKNLKVLIYKEEEEKRIAEKIEELDNKIYKLVEKE